MSDYQRIVDDLRSALSYGGAITPDVSALLESYREACRKANDRLRQCEGMLRQGLRGEAIQLAEIQPNLLDLLAMLDFPERESIDATLRREGLSLPPLYTEAAAELNEAYAAHQPLESLLSRHRYLALSTAPLKERLVTLRRIASVDSMNPVWNEDVAAYETERIKEIQIEANRAITARDFDALETLAAEMIQSRWIRLPPSGFAQKISKAALEARVSCAHDELAILERELNLAYASLDLEQGRALRDKWNATASICSLSGGDPVLQQAAAALEWLAERDVRDAAERAFHQAVSTLDRAFDKPAPTGKTERAHLETLYFAAQRHGYELPATTESRYRSRIEHLDLAASRRTRLHVVAALALIMLVGGGISYGVVRQMHQRRVDAATATFAGLVEHAKNDPSQATKAEEYLAELFKSNPAIAESAPLRTLADQLRESTAAENARAGAFKAAMLRAEREGPSSPDRVALEEAARIARFDEEKGAIARFEAEIASTARTMQSEADTAFTADVSKLSAGLAEVERIGFRDLDKLGSAIAVFESEHEALQAKHSNVSAPVSTQTQPLMKRLNAIKTAAARRRAENMALQAVTRGIGNHEAFLAALTKFAEENPNGGRADDFKRVLGEAAKWNLVELWNKEDAATLQLFKDAAAAGSSTETVERINTSAKALERLPNVESLQVRADLMEGMIGRRDDKGLSTLASLENSFSSQLLNDVWVLTMKNGGERYYLAKQLTLGTSESQEFHFIEVYSGKTKQTYKSLKDIDKVVRAPHCAMSTAALTSLAQMKQPKPEGWEQGVAQIARAICAAKDAEPVLRLGLLKRTLDVGCLGSRPLQRALQLELRLLENTETNLLVNWMKPGDSDAVLAANTADRELKQMADLPTHADAAIADARSERLKASKLAQYQWIGWLINDSDDSWRCVTTAQLPSKVQGRLVVMTPDVPSGPILQTIGSLNQGAIELQQSDRTLLVEGRPVWLESVVAPE